LGKNPRKRRKSTLYNEFINWERGTSKPIKGLRENSGLRKKGEGSIERLPSKERIDRERSNKQTVQRKEKKMNSLAKENTKQNSSTKKTKCY